MMIARTRKGCIWLSLSSGLAIVCLPQGAAAGSSAGCTAYRSGDYVAAMKDFMPLTKKGEAEAQLAVGWLYDNGLGVSHDDGKAVRWYLLAAKQHDARAQQYLGTMYAAGNGVEQNLSAAEKWFRLAAEQDSSGGEFGLGVMYRDGIVVAHDTVEAYKWFGLASRSGQASETDQARSAEMALAKTMTKEQLRSAEIRTKHWRPWRRFAAGDLCKK